MTSEKSLENFRINLLELSEFVSEINTYIGKMNSGKYPINPLILNSFIPIIKSSVSNRNTLEIICEKFSDKLMHESVSPEKIKSRDVNYFLPLAYTLFDEAPKNFVEPIVDIFRNKMLDKETIDDIFTFVDVLVVSSLKWRVGLKNEENMVKFLQDFEK